MLSGDNFIGIIGEAEQGFRLAFERLKIDNPQLLSRGSPVTQNNVAKEAGRDPSALRKSRYPKLVADIQGWISDHDRKKSASPRQKTLKQRQRNRSLKEIIAALKAERDAAASLLVEADMKILESSQEISRLMEMLKLQGNSPDK